MKPHQLVLTQARSSQNLALIQIVETHVPSALLYALIGLAKKAIVINPKPKEFDSYYEMVLSACVETELAGTECLTESQGHTWVNENPTSETGKMAVKSLRALQKNTVDDLLVTSFGENLTVEPMIQIQRTLLKWLLERAFLENVEDDCLYVFGKYMFRRLEPSQERMFIDLVRDVTMDPSCSEKKIRNTLIWLSGENSNLRGKFGERIRQTLAISWQHKLTVADSTHLLGVFHSVGSCSKSAWPAVEIFANRIQLLESEAKRLVEAIMTDCREVLPEGRISFKYDYEGTILTLVVETITTRPPNAEDRIVASLRSFWKKYHWVTDTHKRVPVEVKIGDSLFNLDTGKRK